MYPGFGRALLGVLHALLGFGEGPLSVLDPARRSRRGIPRGDSRGERCLERVTDPRGAQLDRGERGTEGEHRGRGYSCGRPHGEDGLAEGRHRRQRPDGEGDQVREPRRQDADTGDRAACPAPQAAEPATGHVGPDVDAAVAGESVKAGAGRGRVGIRLDGHLPTAGQVRQGIRSDPGIDVDTDAYRAALRQIPDLVGRDPGVDVGSDTDDPVGSEAVQLAADPAHRRVAQLGVDDRLQDRARVPVREPAQLRQGCRVVDVQRDGGFVLRLPEPLHRPVVTALVGGYFNVTLGYAK
ncbi:hypothetical protein [Streptomyces canus]|uniref:hypothetical protein n=1 Tax=Streptomyces canus TaxID=58343 RepID=UPI00216B38CE|nr:hypothetical protein [Streptomyces canus]